MGLCRAWTVLAFLAFSRLSAAHELGTVQVDASFLQDGTYEILALVDLEHLKSGLGPLQDLGQRLAPRLAIDPSIAELYGIFLQDYVSQTVIAFDWVQVPPQVDAVYLAPRPNPPANDTKDYLTIRFRGPIPPGAARFVWASSAKLGTYLLILHQAGDPEPERQFLEPRQESNPYLLKEGIAPPSRLRRLRQLLPYAAAGLAGLGLLAWLLLRRRAS